jgi:hypothetical protein
MNPILLSLLILQLNAGFTEVSVPGDPPVITVSSMEPYELSTGIIISTSDDDGHVIGIKNGNGGQLQAAVFDADGNRIPSIYLDELNEIDLSQLIPGEYILRVVDKDHNMNMYRIRRAD